MPQGLARSVLRSRAPPGDVAIPRLDWAREAEASKILELMRHGRPVVLRNCPLLPGATKWQVEYLSREFGAKPLECVWSPAT